MLGSTAPGVAMSEWSTVSSDTVTQPYRLIKELHCWTGIGPWLTIAGATWGKFLSRLVSFQTQRSVWGEDEGEVQIEGDKFLFEEFLPEQAESCWSLHRSLLAVSGCWVHFIFFSFSPLPTSKLEIRAITQWNAVTCVIKQRTSECVKLPAIVTKKDWRYEAICEWHSRLAWCTDTVATLDCCYGGVFRPLIEKDGWGL